MRKEVIYSLAAIGLTPVAANADNVVVNVTSVDQTGWEAESTIAFNTDAQNNINVSNGGEVYKVLVGTDNKPVQLMAGKYTLKLGVVGNGPVTVKLLTKSGTATEFAQLGEAVSFADANGSMPFTLDETSEIKISVSKATSFYFGKLTLELVFDFDAAAEAYDALLKSFAQNIKGYACNAALSIDTQIENLNNRIAAIKAGTTASEADRLAKYTEEELGKDVDGFTGEDAANSKILAAIKALKNNSYLAEKALLDERVAAIDEIVDGLDTSLYPTELQNEVAAAKAAVADFEAGEKSTDVRALLTNVETKLAKADAQNTALNTVWEDLVARHDAMVFGYTALSKWAEDNLNEMDGNVDKYAGLRAQVEMLIAKDQAALETLWPKIEASQNAGTLFVVKDDNTIDATKGDAYTGTNKAFVTSFNGMYDKLVGTKTDVYTPDASVNTYKYKLEEGDWRTGYDGAYTALSTAKDDVAKAKAIGSGAETNASVAARTAMETAMNNLVNAFNDWSAGIDYTSTANPKAKIADPVNVEIIQKTGAKSKLASLYTSLGVYNDNVSSASGAIKTYLETLDAGKLAWNQDKEAAKAKIADLATTWDELLKEFAETTDAQKAKEDFGYDVYEIWGNGAASVKYTKAWFQSEITNRINQINPIAADANANAKKPVTEIDKFVTLMTEGDATTTPETYGMNDLLKKSGTTFSGKIVDALGKFVEAATTAENWAEWAETADTYLKNNHAKAYYDEEGIAVDVEGSILNESYQDQMAAIADGIAQLSADLAAAAAKDGKDYLEAQATITSNLTSTTVPSLTYAYSKFNNFLNPAVNHSFNDPDGPDSHGVYDKQDAYGKALISDSRYDRAIERGINEVATTVEVIESKLQMLKEGTEKILNKRKNVPTGEDPSFDDDVVANEVSGGDLTAAIQVTTNRMSDSQLTAMYGSKATDIKTQTTDLIANGATYDNASTTNVDESVGLETNATLTGYINDALKVNSSAAAQQAAGKENLDKYSIHLDKLIAKMRVLLSDAEAAAAGTVSTDDFFTTADEELVIGEKDGVSPKDIVGGNTANYLESQLWKYFYQTDRAIRRNSFAAYPYVGERYEDQYNSKYDLLGSTNNRNNPTTLNDCKIKRLIDAIVAAKDNQTLEEKWTAEGGFKEQISEILEEIDLMAEFANDAQALLAQYVDLKNQLEDVGLATPTNTTNSEAGMSVSMSSTSQLWRELDNLLTTSRERPELIRVDEFIAATHFYTYAVTGDARGLLDKQYDKVSTLVSDMASAYTASRNSLISSEYDGTYTEFDEEGLFQQTIDEVMAILKGDAEAEPATPGIVEAAKNNDKFFATECEYIPKNSTYNPKGGEKEIEAKFVEVYGEINNNNETSAAEGYLDELDDLKAEYDELKAANTKTAGWDQLPELYKKGAAEEETATELQRIYTAILEVGTRANENYNADVDADNDALNADVLDEIAAAEAAYQKGVEIQDGLKATSPELKEAIDQYRDQILEYNNKLKEQNDKLVAEKDKYTGTGAGSYTAWENDPNNIGKFYDDQYVKDKKTFTDIKEAIDKAKTDIKKLTDPVAWTVGKKALNEVQIVNDLNAKALTFQMNTSATDAKAKCADENAFGVREDASKHIEGKGKLFKVQKLQNALNAGSYTGNENVKDDFKVSALDAALKAIGDTKDFVSGAYTTFNNLSEADLNKSIEDARDAYEKGEALYGENSEGTAVEKDQWAKDKLLYTDEESTTAVVQRLAAAKKAEIAGDDFDVTKQIGWQHDYIKGALEKFLKNPGNLYTKNANADAAKKKAKELVEGENGLQAQLDAQKDKVIDKGYGAEGQMQKKFDGVQREIDALLETTDMATVKTNAASIGEEIATLVPTDLANAEYDFVTEQINGIKEAFNKMQDAAMAETDATAKAALQAKADAAKADIEQLEKDLDAIITKKDADGKDVAKLHATETKPGAEPKRADYSTQAAYEAAKKAWDDKVAALATERADNDAVAAALKAFEPTVAAKLKAHADAAGITDAAVAAELANAIKLAKDEVSDKAAAEIAKMEYLSDEEQEQYAAEIAKANAELEDATADLEAAKAAGKGGVIAAKNAILDKVRAAEAQVTATETAAKAQNTANKTAKTNSDNAAKAMLEDGVTTAGYGYDAESIKSIEDDIETWLEAVEDYDYVPAAYYEDRIADIVVGLAALKAEVEAVKEDGSAHIYIKKKGSDFVFKKNIESLRTALTSLQNFVDEIEAEGIADDLQQQINAIKINEANYSTKDLKKLQQDLQAIKDAMYKETISSFPWVDPTYSGLLVDIENGEALSTIKKKAENIQSKIDKLKEDLVNKAITSGEELIPGDLDGDGIVTADDVEDFLNDLLLGNVPADASDPLFAVYDANGDGLIDIADAQAIQNLSLGLNIDGSIPGLDAARSAEAPAGNITAETQQLQNGAQRITLTLAGNFDWTGFQMTVKGAEVIAENAQGMSLKSVDKDGAHRIVAFGAAQGNGQVITLDVQGNAQLGTITFATANAQAVSFKLGATTGIYGISTEKSGMFYDLSGKIVKGMKKGVNIIRDAAGKAKKAIMK